MLRRLRISPALINFKKGFKFLMKRVLLMQSDTCRHQEANFSTPSKNHKISKTMYILKKISQWQQTQYKKTQKRKGKR